MANKKLSDLPEWTVALSDDDLFLVLPSSETTQHYKFKKSNLPGGSSQTVEHFTSLATSGNFQSTGVAITGVPTGDVLVLIDGIGVVLATDRTDDCYFSTDGGATALTSITAGAILYWNGTINGAKSLFITFGDLITDNRITLIYS